MKNILVVDDSSAIRVVIRRMLEAQGFTVSLAEDGKKALEHCRRHEPPAGILLDVNMPEMDGMECLRELRGDRRLEQCRIVMCTTRTEIENITRAIDLGANEYIMKPFTEEILVDKLRQVGLLE